ncbi:MAG: T9SS type A sorting domain-containing protein [Flavobacteriales bacterium]
MKTLITLTSFLLCINPTFSQTGQLAVNNISVTINPSNVMFQTLAPDTNLYFEAIKGSGLSTLFSSALWVGGIRSSDTALCGSQQAYKFNSIVNTFSTGPLSATIGTGTIPPFYRDYGAATISETEKAKWEKVFCVEKWEIEIFVRFFNCFQDPSCDVSISFPGYTIPNSIINWPAHGVVSLGQDFYLAPFFDYDSDGIYSPSQGDYPCIKGDQYCWFVINDRGDDTTRTELGLEIHTEVYSFKRDSSNPLSNTIFVGRDIINRSSATYTDFIVAQQTDFDIGCAQDDYIGSMPSLNSYFGYNADQTDDNCSGNSNPYGINPPAQGVTFLNKSINASVYYNNTAAPSQLNEIEKAYNSMNGRNRDGTPIYYGAPSSAPPVPTNITKYMFPYLPPSGRAPWNEVSASNPAGDRRMLGSVAPITLTPGQVHEVDIAYVFSRNDSGNLESVDKLYRDIQTVQQFYTDSIPAFCGSFVLSQKELTLSQNDVALYPNPATHSFKIENETNEILTGSILSIDGKLVVSEFEISSNNDIDISRLTSGIYLVRVTNAKNQIVLKKLLKH